MSNTDKPYLVFVYGSLKKGGRLNPNMGGGFISEGVTVDSFALEDGGSFPYMIRDENAENKVEGEVYEIDADTLTKLDWIEGEGSHYDRIVVGVRLLSEHGDGGDTSPYRVTLTLNT